MTSLRIAELRKEKNISQEELADILNTSRQAVSKWERGESYPDIDRLKELAIYFNVSIDYIIGYDIESTSVASFINKVKECIENKTYDYSLNDIKALVRKNNNSFNVIASAVSYLLYYWNKDPKEEIIDLIIEYSKKGLVIYQKDNSLNVKINDIHQAIIVAYMMKKRYDLAKKYIEENEVYNMETFLANAELELGNYEKASDIISGTFLSSISTIINGNIIQVLALNQNNKIKEAYDLALWSINFIKSIAKNDSLFVEDIYIYTFFKAVNEKNLNLDYQESLDFLKENYHQVINSENNSENIKFYYGEKATFINIYSDIRNAITDYINKMPKENNNKDDALHIYKEVFGGN